MKVTRVETYATWAGLRNWVFVKVRTDGGLHGWGEATLETKEASVQSAVHELGRLLIGEDPLAVEHHWQRLHRRFWRGGIVLSSALAALDQALWDLRGKAWDVPVHRLLGGPTRERVRLYTHVGMYDPERLEEDAQAAVAAGFTAVKTGAWLTDADRAAGERVEAAAERVGRLRTAVGKDVELLYDNHGRSSAAEAIALGRALLNDGVAWLEEPTPPEDFEALARVRAAVPELDLAAGERLYSKWEVAPLLERRLVDVVQPDLCHAGGITECRKIAAVAEAHHVDVAPHNPQGPVSTAAAAQLALAIPNFRILELVRQPPAGEALVVEPWPVVDGNLAVPEAPGLGIEINEATLAASPSRPLGAAVLRRADGSVADV